MIETTRAIKFALVMNAGITAIKYGAAMLTGSSSVLAEAIHSTADTANQGLLLVSQRAKHNRWAVVACLVILSLAILTIAEGVSKLSRPTMPDHFWLGLGVLGVSAALETGSFWSAAKAMRRNGGLKGHPELLVVLVEDSAALVGLALAATGVIATATTHNPVWDAVATLAIGVLLAAVAALLLKEIREA